MKNRCIICSNTGLIQYMDLGKTALANSYLQDVSSFKNEHRFPLKVYYCPDCHLAQLGHIVDRNIIFKNYAYLSSSSSPLKKYFKKYFKDIKGRFPSQTKKLVVDIGSNDGLFLSYFKKNGSSVLGVDPAKNVAKIATQRGIQTIPQFFSFKIALAIEKKYGKASIITANHVLAHTEKVNDIVRGVKELLTPTGVFVFEVQYLADLIKNNGFDITYHEHISYFSLLPLHRLFSKWGLEIFDAQKVDAQGGSIRVFVGHQPLLFKKTRSLRLLQKEEILHNLNKVKTYRNFSKKPEKIKKDLNTLLTKLKKQSKKIAAYGASAKGSTMLQYSEIGPKIIDYIVDDTPTKIGKFTPGTHIPVVHSSYLRTNLPDYVLILSWNYADSIIKKEEWLKKFGTKFIVPIPKVKII